MVLNINSLTDGYSVLDSLEMADVPIQSQCRNGFCGACKCSSSKKISSSGKSLFKNLDENEFLACVTRVEDLKVAGLSEIQVVNYYSF